MVQESNKRIYKVADYVILHGKYAGKTIQVGFPIPIDFPTTAPYGIHVKSGGLITDPIPAPNPSPLGGDWQFWSRQIQKWTPGRRCSQYYLDNVDRWLEFN